MGVIQTYIGNGKGWNERALPCTECPIHVQHGVSSNALIPQLKRESLVRGGIRTMRKRTPLDEKWIDALSTRHTTLSRKVLSCRKCGRCT